MDADDLAVVRELAEEIHGIDAEQDLLQDLDFAFRSERMMKELTEALAAGHEEVANAIEREFREFYHEEQMNVYRLMYDNLTLEEEMQIEEMLQQELDDFITVYRLAAM